jgi:hypothetical protein
MKTEVVIFPETLVTSYKTAWRHNPEDKDRHPFYSFTLYNLRKESEDWHPVRSGVKAMSDARQWRAVWVALPFKKQLEPDGMLFSKCF